MRRIEIDEIELCRLIEDQQLPHWRVAEILGVGVDTIARRCRQFGLTTQRTGPRGGHLHPDWKGGRRVVDGYVYLYRPDHPRTTKQRYVSEHRLVMEAKIGRYLEPTEVVHHKNDQRDDNRPENLELFQDNASHLIATRSGQTPKWSEEGKERIRTGWTKRASQLRKEIGVPQRSQQTGRFEAKPDKPSQGVS